MERSSLLDLRPLANFIVDRELQFQIGKEPTKADGNCFLNAILQNLKYLESLGLWKNRKTPSSVLELRKEVILFMKQNKRDYIEAGSHDEESFDRLLSIQQRNYEYTDEEGYFVEATAKYLNVELVILIPSLSNSPILPSGCGGPVQRINAGEDRLRCCLGLLRDEARRTGHYQFIIQTQSFPEIENTLHNEATGG